MNAVLFKHPQWVTQQAKRHSPRPRAITVILISALARTRSLNAATTNLLVLAQKCNLAPTQIILWKITVWVTARVIFNRFTCRTLLLVRTSKSPSTAQWKSESIPALKSKSNLCSLHETFQLKMPVNNKITAIRLLVVVQCVILRENSLLMQILRLEKNKINTRQRGTKALIDNQCKLVVAVRTPVPWGLNLKAWTKLSALTGPNRLSSVRLWKRLSFWKEIWKLPRSIWLLSPTSTWWMRSVFSTPAASTPFKLKTFALDSKVVWALRSIMLMTFSYFSRKLINLVAVVLISTNLVKFCYLIARNMQASWPIGLIII